MSANAINYKIGGDASELGKAFQHALRFTGDFLDQAKKAMSFRGMFDGLAGGLQQALGGANFGEVLAKSIKGALGGEQIQQQFEGLLGGGKNAAPLAEAMIGQLKAFASDANFATQEMLDTAAKMVGPEDSGMMNGARAVQSLKMLGEVARAGGPPLSELGSIWAKMFEAGKASARDLMTLAPVGIFAGLQATTGNTREELEKMGEQGKISFDMMNAAMAKLTGKSGRFFGQIERYKNSNLALADNAKETFGKIPGAFFAGMVGVGMGAAKERLRDINGMLEGWVHSAQRFGSVLAAGLQTVRGLSADGKLWETIGDGLQGVFTGSINMLIRGLAGAASGFGTALSKAFGAALDMAFEVMKDAANLFGENKGSAGSRIAEAFNHTFTMAITKDGIPQFPNDASKRFHDRADPIFRNAMGLMAPDFIGPLITDKQRAQLALPGGSEGANDSISRGFGAGFKNVAPDAMAKIGLFVGPGGAQGEAHARDTARNTKQANTHLKKIEKNTKRKGGLTTFSSE